MTNRKIELSVGIFVIIGLFCTGYLYTVLGGVVFNKEDHYQITAFFSSVAGLKQGARVEMAGVQIGTVANISIDTEQLMARVVFNLEKNIELSEDIMASVKTSGIIGQKYIDILPGGSDVLLESGDEIYTTESSLDIESLVRKFIFNTENKTSTP